MIFKNFSSIKNGSKIATIFAGVNGAGKTTLYFKAQEKGIILGYRVNVDEIAQSIGNYKNTSTQIRATKIALNTREQYLKNGYSFNQETTLCGKSIINLFHRLKEYEYKINLFYVGVSSPKIAKERVLIRVNNGGHNIEPNLIEKRYYESLENLMKVLPLCDKTFVYDNSIDYELIAKADFGVLEKFKSVEWFSEIANNSSNNQTLADLAKKFGIDVETVESSDSSGVGSTVPPTCKQAHQKRL